MAVSLYLLEEQKKMRHKWLNRAAEQLGYLEDDIAA